MYVGTETELPIHCGHDEQYAKGLGVELQAYYDANPDIEHPMVYAVTELMGREPKDFRYIQVVTLTNGVPTSYDLAD